MCGEVLPHDFEGSKSHVAIYIIEVQVGELS